MHWGHHLPVPLAQSTLANSRMIERADLVAPLSQRSEFVYIVLTELVVQEHRGCRSERIFRQGRREEQGGGVHRRKECRIDRHDWAKSPEHFASKLISVQPDIATSNELPDLAL